MQSYKIATNQSKEVKTNVCNSRTALPMLNEWLLPESALPFYDPKGDRSRCMWSRWWLCHQWSEIDLVSFKLFSTNCFTKSATLVCKKLDMLLIASFYSCVVWTSFWWCGSHRNKRYENMFSEIGSIMTEALISY